MTVCPHTSPATVSKFVCGFIGINEMLDAQQEQNITSCHHFSTANSYLSQQEILLTF